MVSRDRDLYLEVMTLSDEELERYARHIILKEIGGAGQMRLKGARVAVIGAGGIALSLIHI